MASEGEEFLVPKKDYDQIKLELDNQLQIVRSRDDEIIELKQVIEKLGMGMKKASDMPPDEIQIEDPKVRQDIAFKIMNKKIPIVIILSRDSKAIGVKTNE